MIHIYTCKSNIRDMINQLRTICADFAIWTLTTSFMIFKLFMHIFN